MAHAVANGGYQATSVAQVIKLAGVSRTTFYEHFANKQDCFLATYDMMAYRMTKNIRGAYHTAGDWQESLTAAFDALGREVVNDPSAIRMLLADVADAGPAAIDRARRAGAVFSRMLHRSLTQAQPQIPVSPALVRGLFGGIRGCIYRALREDQTTQLPILCEELAHWTISYHHFSDSEQHPLGSGKQTAHFGDAASNEPSVLGLTPRRRKRGEGGPSDSRHQSFMARFEQISRQATRSTACAYLAATDWPAAIHESLTALIHFLAAHPNFGRLGFSALAGPGEGLSAHAHELLDDFAALLTRGYELNDTPPAAIASAAVTAAIWENIRHEAVRGRMHLLGALSDQLAYLALAPFVGPSQASSIINISPQITSSDAVQAISC